MCTVTQYDESLIGRRLGAGSYREVYAYGTDKVIKFSRWGDSWDNLEEARMWDRLSKTDHARFFMPVQEYCKIDGCYLVMDKVFQTAVQARTDRVPEELLDVAEELDIVDLHKGNFGYNSDGSPVMFDYQY